MKEDLKGLLSILFVSWAVSSWLTHVFTCFIDSDWGVLIAGTLMFPIAFLHGTWLWF